MKNTAIVIIIIFLLTFSIQKCQQHNTAVANIKALNSEILTYKLSNGQLVASKQSLELTKLQLEDLVISKDAELQDMANNFSKVKTVTKIVTVLKLDTIKVPFDVEIPCEFERNDIIYTKHYSFDYKFTNKGFSINNLSIPDSISIVTGTKRKWFWGKETQIIDITHSNPNIQTTGLNRYEITNKKKWHQKDAVKMTTAVVLFELAKGLFMR